MFKKTNQNAPKILGEKGPELIPMEIDNSKTIPMLVESTNADLQRLDDVISQLNEEDFIPSVEAIEETKYATGGVLPEGSHYVVGEGSAELLKPIEAAKPVVVLVKDQVVEAQGKTCRVVEVVSDNRYHVKNINEPYDSFIVTSEELI